MGTNVWTRCWFWPTESKTSECIHPQETWTEPPRPRSYTIYDSTTSADFVVLTQVDGEEYTGLGGASRDQIRQAMKEQLKAWESSEMNKLAPVRRPPDRSKVKFQDSDVFLSACVSGDEEEIDELLDKGADINTMTIDGVTALHQAVIDGKLETIRFLLDRNANINAQDNEGWTPLHAAVCCGSLPIIKYLCERGADLTFVNSDKELAIDLAEDDEIRDYLNEQLRALNIDAEECRDQEYNTMMKDCTEWIRCGRYLDKPHPRTGATALHVAASKGYNHLIGLLIRAGADVHARDAEGWTPLHAAAHWGEKDACRVLMENGAKLTEINYADQNVLRVADKTIVEYLESLQSTLEAKKAPAPVQPSASANNILQPVQHSASVTTSLKRASVPRRLSTDEKILLTKKDEHDENVSMVVRGGAAEDEVKRHHSPDRNSPSPTPVALTVLGGSLTPTPEKASSLSPPPAKRAATDSTDSVLPTATPTAAAAVMYRGFKGGSAEPSVASVPPAPRAASTSAINSSKAGSVASEGAAPTASRAYYNQPASAEMTSAILATQKPPPAAILRPASTASVSSAAGKAPLSEAEPDLDDDEEGEDEAAGDEEDEEAEDEEETAPVDDRARTEDNTGSGISSIRTSSRSLSNKDSPSSNLYSSDQSIECTVRMPQPSRPTNNALGNSSQMTSTSTTPLTLRNSPWSASASHVPASMGTATSTAATVTGVSVSSSTSAISRDNAPASPTPGVVYRKPVTSCGLHQRPTTAQQASNTPWIAHVKSGSLSAVNRNVHVFNGGNTSSGNQSNASGISSISFRPTTGGITSRVIHPTPAYQKYTSTLRSWQTPPTLPVSQKESEAERKANSRMQRASRRSTQHVTTDQINEARAAVGSVESGSNSTVAETSSASSPAPASSTANRWRSAALSTVKQPIATTTTTSSSTALNKPHHRSGTDDRATTTKTTTTASGSSVTLLSTMEMNAPSATPSANKFRRSQMVRGNRRETGPVDFEALSIATGSAGGGDATPTTPSPPPGTDATDSLAERFSHVTVRKTPKYQESQTPSSHAYRQPVTGIATPAYQQNGPSTVGSSHQNVSASTSDAATRYKYLYEMEREENDKLRKRIEELSTKANETSSPPPALHNGAVVSRTPSSRSVSSVSVTSDDHEKRALERKIAQLEYELEHAKRVATESSRLKAENDALIRVLSKLSRNDRSVPQRRPSNFNPTTYG